MKLLFVKFPFGTEMRMSQQNHEGGWSGIGMATVGIHPNDFDLYPNKIPPGRVVQNCHLCVKTSLKAGDLRQTISAPDI